MRILIVEDEVKVAAFIRQALEEEGHAVEATFDGVDGLQRALSTGYDLILLDLSLPHKDADSYAYRARIIAGSDHGARHRR